MGLRTQAHEEQGLASSELLKEMVGEQPDF